MPRHTFSAVLGAVTAAGRDGAETFQYLRPRFDLAAERQRRENAALGERYSEDDLYPDVLWAGDPKVHKLADWRIDSLTELPALIAAARA